MDRIIIYSLPPLIMGILSGVLGYLVFHTKRKTKEGLSFLLLTIVIFFYGIFYSLFPTLQHSKTLSLLIFQLISVPTTLIGVLLLNFAINFTDKVEKYKNVLKIGYALSLLVLLGIPSKLYIKDMVPKFGWNYWAEPGVLHHFSVVLLFSYTILSFGILIGAYKKSKSEKKSQIRIITLGSGIGLLAGATNFFYWYNINIPPVIVPIIAIWPLSIWYAIVTKKLFDIKLVLRSSVVYLFSLLSVVLLFVPLKIISVQYFSDFVSFVDILFLFIALSIYPQIKNFYFNFANKYFFTSLYDSKEIISELSKKLTSTLEDKKIYSDLSNTIKDRLHARALGILSYKEKDNRYYIEFNSGFNTNNEDSFESNQ
ncbi:hypothetical protein C0584_04900 [Candidatus Parcubacteria bacterium]|nr:MAG: hypothetical protein C0584_04900 [Candidatus Parcubacteria bacterium]